MNYSVEEAFKLLGIGRTKFYQELNAGHIKAVKVGTRTLIPQSSIDEWCKNLEPYVAKQETQ